MTTPTIITISPQEAQHKMEQGAALLDVREYPEWVESHIPGATLIPVGDIKKSPHKGALAPEVLVVCRSGKRARQVAQALAEAGTATPFVVQGGLDGWKNAGLPAQAADAKPLSMERQVRIGAGALVLLGLLVPRLRVVSYFVPCGLIFAGLSGTCGMASVLAKAPWNRPRGDEKARSYALAMSHKTP